MKKDRNVDVLEDHFIRRGPIRRKDVRMNPDSLNARTKTVADSPPVGSGKKASTKEVPHRRKIERFKGDGVKITLVIDERRACIRFNTSYALDSQTRFDVAAILATHALRRSAHPQVGPRQGFCSTIHPKHALEVAKRVFGRLRRDKQFAELEKMRDPPCCVR
jgi:hypothetical protein